MVDETLDDVYTLLKDYQQSNAIGMNIVSRQTMVEQYETETRSAAVMGYAISIMIALVGVLNFINSMVTAIILRKCEFAMIQSIGMTKLIPYICFKNLEKQSIVERLRTTD